MKKIAERRQELKLTQVQVAEAVGVKINTYRSWEYGQNQPGKASMEKLAKILETTTQEMEQWMVESDPTMIIEKGERVESKKKRIPKSRKGPSPRTKAVNSPKVKKEPIPEADKQVTRIKGPLYTWDQVEDDVLVCVEYPKFLLRHYIKADLGCNKWKLRYRSNPNSPTDIPLRAEDADLGTAIKVADLAIRRMQKA